GAAPARRRRGPARRGGGGCAAPRPARRPRSRWRRGSRGRSPRCAASSRRARGHERRRAPAEHPGRPAVRGRQQRASRHGAIRAAVPASGLLLIGRWRGPGSRVRSTGAGPRPAAGSPVVDGVAQLLLVHRGPPLDALALRVLVALVLGASLRTRVGAVTAALRGGLVLHGGAAGLLGLALLGAGLVHGAGGDLLRLVLRGALVQLAVLDVLVLALALPAPFLGHGVLLISSTPQCRRARPLILIRSGAGVEASHRTVDGPAP